MCCLGHFEPFFVRHAAHCGFDCIWLDLEHREMDAREVQALLAYFHLYDIDCMLRPPATAKTRLYRYLEDGATGLMIPHVSTSEMAADLVQSVKFPPIGNRGLDGAGLDGDFYTNSTEEYVEHCNRETFLVVQIETPEAVANIDAIASVEGLDGLFIGPGDLSLRIRHLPSGELSLEQATEKVAAAAKKHRKAWGRPAGTFEHLQQFHAQGAQLVSHGGEFHAIMEMLKQSAANFDRLGST
jgi:4-hydroxy-2-oxoheptanedioate aldolase